MRMLRLAVVAMMMMVINVAHDPDDPGRFHVPCG